MSPNRFARIALLNRETQQLRNTALPQNGGLEETKQLCAHRVAAKRDGRCEPLDGILRCLRSRDRRRVIAAAGQLLDDRHRLRRGSMMYGVTCSKA